VAFALRYRSPDRTLTNDEVNEAHQRLIQHLERALEAKQRV